MDDQKLRQHLFSETTRLYGVLDGIMVPGLPNRLYEGQIPNYCLLKGDLTPDLVHAAPYLVLLSPDSKFTDWVLSESIGKFWGIFFQSRHSIREMRRHFRAMSQAYDESGNRIAFRFYDPRVLRKYLPSCTPEELEAFFGKASTFFAEAEDRKNLLSFKLENGALKQTDLK